ncbi:MULTISPECIES: Uma2 family endonuclease [Calothrix]|uniref:Uma2 family endonuclease n=2 Tax=Calothrix TaxID=1186 RepID=A0ABR8AAY9_9CYAN|nr:MULTISPECIES: Uma2 family endonuclease [Calothrix]MBD2197024.1 Uma2 family endonuclease [Calothrix parietina FACHB-288]MBD2225755.1 Uma2 family endonuclease [Calothrix anomala FACHB-343]
MTAVTKKLTFTEYLQYRDGTDTQYELVDGELIPMSLGTGKHGGIAKFLERTFDDESTKMGKNWTAQKFAVGIRSPRGGRWETSRIPDVVVLPTEQWEALFNREAIIELNEPPPILVVEVVSESTQTTDYRSKRSEYAVLGIPEYWIVDPIQGIVTVCTLVEGFYDAIAFPNQERLISPTFPNLDLTAAQILAGR